MTFNTTGLALTMTAASALKRTWLFDAIGSKPVPLIVTAVPTGPLAGVNDVIANAGWMVKVMTPGSRLAAVAMTVTCPTAAPVSVKATLVPFAGIVTVGGKLAVPDPVALSVTARPPAGAGSLEVTVTVVLAPEMSVVVGAVNTSATGCFTVSTVLAEIVTFWPVALATKPKLASIVAVPAASALATPEPLIEATTTLSERDDQTTLVVKSSLVPSVIVPVAVNCTDSPT